MEVTGQDAEGHDVGYVLATSPDRAPLHDSLLDLLGEKRGRFALFVGRRVVTSGPELERSARQLVQDFYKAKEAARSAAGG